MNRVLLIILTLILLVFIIMQINQYGKFYSYLIFSKTAKTEGILRDIKRIDDINGIISYDYSIEYNVENTKYSIVEHVSPDSLKLMVLDSMEIIYSKNNPKYAYSNYNYNFLTPLWHLAIIIVFVLIMVRVLLKNTA
mgnify:CR=1 FL=1